INWVNLTIVLADRQGNISLGKTREYGNFAFSSQLVRPAEGLRSDASWPSLSPVAGSAGVVVMPRKSIEYLAPIGRALLSIIFLASAAGKFAQWQDTVKMLVDKNLPNPELLLGIAAGLEIVGGAMVFLGLYARVGAVLLLLFLVPASFIMHNFWTYE